MAISNNVIQQIVHYYKSIDNKWEKETIVSYNNEGGQYIYELSADIGSDGTFHLLVLKTRSNPDSYDYYWSFVNAHLYYVNNVGNKWNNELIHNYNMLYTLDEYSKTLNRQDIKIDKQGNAHVIYGEQINTYGLGSDLLNYCTNASGDWKFEIALNFSGEERASAGWYPSLCLDNDGVPHISCAYISRYI
ncbi:hypothetical protein ACFLTI_08815, partial [Bacteroidota bacterium]